MMGQLLSRENLLLALKRVEKNKGSHGVDGMSVKSLRQHILSNWDSLRASLENGTYVPSPVRRVEIPKLNGGVRLLGIPTVTDRLIQQAIAQVLSPIFDPMFSEHSHGFRPRRRGHDAVKKAQTYIEEGYRWVVDMDLEKFFDKVNHDKLMGLIAKHVKDRTILTLIRRYLESGIMVNGMEIESDQGVPQGGPLSPLLSNIMLHELDKELEKRGLRFLRYADDCNIYVKSKKAGIRVMDSVTTFIERKLKLKVNMEKSAVDRPWNRKFLGFSFTVNKSPKIRIANDSLKRAKQRIREITSRTKPLPMEYRIDDLNEYLTGWCGYFALADTPSVFSHLDEWIRRRLRMCLWKEWKRPKTKVKRLISLGVPKEKAYEWGNSRKKQWRIACSPILHRALNNAYWRNQGLKSLSDRYTYLRHT
ncbi:RNA-directed DNA polymerase [Brevibacillus panacihumi W25]|uniref:RNA-directed DNA polymerase n=3 Tax=Brevibacillus panacihumi TaxID=497735 RepID=V6MDL6_9BACL|nr:MULTISPECIES: group II intron reverse transcriptase/maturase [Bacillales]EJD4908097.1 group II intron reverse transcriptase/maturase [Escherichia coli]EST51516.1 RNA-directed DNA polymerase [Brevibacillus panacihumi W25]EST53271.1 RNA-directed DNA polymerase [Brevibacillus panacihumi W25]EST54635.1 RNA-directed DNA polymerase [Brevibacillus panacihumi W25]EST54888.1 RNA-directed DNA polymerase [Brevibacillus panacihumi W25]